MISKNQFDKIFMTSLILLVGVFVYSVQGNELPKVEDPIDVVVKETKPNPFKELDIIAPSVMVYDILNDEVLFSRNEHEQRALASITKLMSATVAIELLEPNEVIYITPSALSMEGDNGLFLNEAWRAENLLALTLIASSNDAVRAIREHAQNTGKGDLVDLMNKKSRELGLSKTYFNNESGLDESEVVSGSYSSAHDTVKLLTYIFKNHSDIFKVTKQENIQMSSINYGEHTFKNTNKTVGSIPSAILSKTGFTDIAGGNLAIIFEKEPLHPIAIVVLGSTIDGRFTDVEQLIWATIKN